MWVVLRLLTALIVYLLRFFWRRQGSDSTGLFRDVQSALRTVRHKKQFVRAYHGLAYEGPLKFQLTREGRWDTFFKNLGLAAEQTTGDRSFDEEIYITCDQTALGAVLRRDPEARAAIMNLFEMGAEKVFSDGAQVWVQIGIDGLEQPVLELLYEFRRALVAPGLSASESQRDNFFWKAMAVEALTWSVAFYGVLGFVELAAKRNTLYLDPWSVVQTGCLWSIGVLAGLLGLVFLLLRGSSRGHRIIVEGVFLLLVGVPLSTIQAVSDINIQADNTPPVIVESKVIQKRTEVRRRRRGRTSTHYYLHLQPVTNQRYQLADSIEVQRGIYSGARDGGLVAIVVREGRLGLPWIESISPR